MPKGIDEITRILLNILAANINKKDKPSQFSGPQVTKLTGLNYNEINDAASILQSAGFAELLQDTLSSPYIFEKIAITPRGLYEFERISSYNEINQIFLPPIPVGSPYGFTDGDWELVSERKAQKNILTVVFGYQFSSSLYETEKVIKNIEKMFIDAIAAYCIKPGIRSISLNFRPLEAGYGEHLFNEIARDIISSDIAVFEVSDLNPNVMIELGVALTWGVRVLPIKSTSSKKLPSDIFGQTYAYYKDNANIFVDKSHSDKLIRMVERAIRKKVAT